jgi:UDP-glucose 4-epimerase
VKVLVTGGAGFIGSHMTKLLESKNHEVTVIDLLNTGKLENLERFGFRGKFVEEDIRNSNAIEKLINNCDLVLHFAAALGVSNIMNNTMDSLSTNIHGSEVVLKAAAKFSRRILIASTSEIYGKNPVQPLSENSDRVIGNPQNFRWSYSDAKAIEEAMASSLAQTDNLKVITVRFFNTVGPGQTSQYGMVVPRFVESALKNEPLQVHGDGSQSRVFCHVADAVNAVYELINSDQSDGQVFNVGGEGEVTIMDLAQKIIELTDSKSKIQQVPYSKVYPIGFEDMMRRVPDTSKIKDLTGWNANKSLEDIINDVASHSRLFIL